MLIVSLTVRRRKNLEAGNVCSLLSFLALSQVCFPIINDSSLVAFRPLVSLCSFHNSGLKGILVSTHSRALVLYICPNGQHFLAHISARHSHPLSLPSWSMKTWLASYWTPLYSRFVNSTLWLYLHFRSNETVSDMITIKIVNITGIPILGHILNNRFGRLSVLNCYQLPADYSIRDFRDRTRTFWSLQLIIFKWIYLWFFIHKLVGGQTSLVMMFWFLIIIFNINGEYGMYF